MTAERILRDQAAAAIVGDKQLCMLTSMAERHGDTFLNVLFPLKQSVEVVRPAGAAKPLDPFCDLICQTDEGYRRCSTCRYLIACACQDHQSRYCCHGGISVIASAANRIGHSNGNFTIVTSGPFRRDGERDQWKDVLTHVKDIPVDRRELKANYEKLPILDEEKQSLLAEIVELAAARINELIRQTGTDSAGRDARSSLEPEEDFSFALSLSKDGEMDEPGAPALIRLVTGIVKRNPGLLLSVDKIARAAHLTPNYFSAVFHKHTGQTFSRFLSEHRMAHSKRLLKDPGYNISEVAMQCGFSDSNYFSRAFKRDTGVSPTEWRQTHGG